jgi:hypothetical protein
VVELATSAERSTFQEPAELLALVSMQVTERVNKLTLPPTLASFCHVNRVHPSRATGRAAAAAPAFNRSAHVTIRPSVSACGVLKSPQRVDGAADGSETTSNNASNKSTFGHRLLEPGGMCVV